MHECPECAGNCDCFPGDIAERNCTHCYEFDDEDDADLEDDDDDAAAESAPA